MHKTLFAAALMTTMLIVHAAYKCDVTPRDDVILNSQTVQVKGENGNLVITSDGNVMYNDKQYTLSNAQRKRAKDYQANLRTALSWIDDSARTCLKNGYVALDKIIAHHVGAGSNIRTRLTKLDARLKEQMNRIIEHRSDGLTFHYKAIDRVRADGHNLFIQTMGGILQDSINEIGVKAVLKFGSNPLQVGLGSFVGLQAAIQNEWKNQEAKFRAFGKDVCKRVVFLEDSRKALIGMLK